MTNLQQLSVITRSALQALHANTATPSTVKQAEATLSQVKQTLDATTALDLSELLLAGFVDKTKSIPTTPEIQFSFHLLDENLFRTSIPWIQFSDIQRNRVRNLATKLISVIDQLPQYAKTRVVDLLVDVAIREWPQRWPDLFPHLMAGVPPQIACRVLTGLSEEIHQFADAIVPIRRQELRKALALSLSDALQFVIQTATVSHEQSNVELLKDALECLRSFLSWASLPSIFAAGVPIACTRLLGNLEVRDASLAVITMLASRKITTTWEKADGLGEAAEFHPEVAFRGLFNAIMEYVSTEQIFVEMGSYYLLRPTNLLPLHQKAFDSSPVGLDNIDEDNHEFRIKFFEMLSELGSSHFISSFLFSQRTGAYELTPDVQSCAASYIDQMICALTFPSIAIQLTVLPFFTSILNNIAKKEERGAAEKLIQFLIKGVLNAISATIIQLPYNNERKAFKELDIMINVTNGDMYDSFVPRSIALLTLVAKLSPEEAITMSLNRLFQLLSCIPSRIDNASGLARGSGMKENIQPRKYIIPKHDNHEWSFGSFSSENQDIWIACTEAACSFNDAITTTLVNAKHFNDQPLIWSKLREAFESFLRISQGEYAALKAYALRTFFALYTKDMDALNKGAETIVLIIFDPQTPKDVRHKASSFLAVVLRRLSNANITAIKNFAVPLCQKATECLQNSTYKIAEKCNILEAAFACVMQMDTVNEQSALVESVLHPVLENMRNDVLNLVTSPQSLVSFLQSNSTNKIDRLCEAFATIETATHLVTRSAAKSHLPLQMPGVLSRSIAPYSVEVVSALINVLHALYNTNTFSTINSEKPMKNLLYPTNKEIAQLLNLRSSEQWSVQTLSISPNTDKDKKQVMITDESRYEEILTAYGIRPQGFENYQIREVLRHLRKSSYEIARAAILSGVTNSPSHLTKLLNSITQDYEVIEAHHLLTIISRLLSPLFSYSVLISNESCLSHIAESKVPRLLTMVRQHIEAFQCEKLILTESPALDIAREYGRTSLPRAVADMLTGMFPKIEKSSKEPNKNQIPVYMPTAFSIGALGQELQLLWKTICSPTPGQTDNNAARVGFTLATSAVEMAPESSYSVFGPLLLSSLRVAVLNNAKLTEDTPADIAIGTTLAIFRKWPQQSEQSLRETFGSKNPQVHQWIVECITTITSSGQSNSKSKKHRQLIKTLVEKIAEVEGTSSHTKRKVHSLPEKLIARNPARMKNKHQPDLEDVELEEFALESLFGEGDPL